MTITAQAIVAEVHDKFGWVIEIGDIIRSLPPKYSSNFGRVVRITDAQVIGERNIPSGVSVELFNDKAFVTTVNFDANYVQILGEGKSKYNALLNKYEEVLKNRRDWKIRYSELKLTQAGYEKECKKPIAECPICSDDKFFYSDFLNCPRCKHVVCKQCVKKNYIGDENKTYMDKCPQCRLDIPEPDLWENVPLDKVPKLERNEGSSQLKEDDLRLNSYANLYLVNL